MIYRSGHASLRGHATNVLSTQEALPAAPGSASVAARQRLFAEGSERTASRGLTRDLPPATFSRFKRVCYLFASPHWRRLGPAACAARFAEMIGRAPPVVVRDDSRRPLAVVLRASGDAQCRQTAIFPRFPFAPRRTTHSHQTAIHGALQSAVFGRRGTLSRRGLVAFGQNWREYARSTR